MVILKCYFSREHIVNTDQCTSVQWLALWLSDPQVADTNPVEDNQGYEMFKELVLKNRRLYLFAA